MLVFFFSSRRRHTRWPRDWSSDVCSSDLAAGVAWSDLEGLGSQDGTALREGLPVVDEVALLVAGDGPGPQASALSRALTALAPGGGTVVVDLSASLVAAAAEHLDRLLLVTTATDQAVRATARRLDIWPLPAGLVSDRKSTRL